MQTLEEQKETVSQLRTEIAQANDIESLKSILNKMLDVLAGTIDEDLGGWFKDQPTVKG